MNNFLIDKIIKYDIVFLLSKYIMWDIEKPIKILIQWI